jgi:hypothetical protein
MTLPHLGGGEGVDAGWPDSLGGRWYADQRPPGKHVAKFMALLASDNPDRRAGRDLARSVVQRPCTQGGETHALHDQTPPRGGCTAALARYAAHCATMCTSVQSELV